jgi:hypothetical protein
MHIPHEDLQDAQRWAEHAAADEEAELTSRRMLEDAEAHAQRAAEDAEAEHAYEAMCAEPDRVTAVETDVF